ncbi:MAG: hypothetical protein ABEK01_02990 [Candidatus Nanohaloarchaea archaeon]
MGWAAVEEIDEALERTKDLLLPFDWKLWAKIAVLALFTGGMNAPSIPTGFGGDTGGDYSPPAGESRTSINSTVSAPMTGLSHESPSLGVSAVFIAGLMLVFVPIVIFFLVISGVFEFVYYQSLLDEDVQIRSNFSKHFGNGLKLAGFRFFYFIGYAVLFGMVILGFMANFLVGLLFLLAAIPVAILYAVFGGLTTQFIPLRMIETGMGLVEAWKDFYPELRAEWKEVAVYVIARFFLGMAGGVLTLFGALALLIPAMFVIGIPVAVLFVIFPPLGALGMVAGIFVYIGLLVYFVQGPVQTYMKYYTILVYHELTS